MKQSAARTVKVRKVVLFFKRSPTKNDTIPQKFVKTVSNTELFLLLNCRNRSNNLLTMLERFAQLKIQIQKAVIDLNNTVTMNEADFDQGLI